jgi:hypothetical protein
MATNLSVLVVVQDILYTLVLSEVNLTGKIIKMVIDTLIFVCLINLYYIPKAKKFKKILKEITSRDQPIQAKWEVVELKLKL